MTGKLAVFVEDAIQDSVDTPGLYFTDGTAANSYILPLGLPEALAYDLAVLGDQVIFGFRTENNFFETLWISDGTAAGTHEITGIDNVSTNYGLDPQGLRVVGNQAFFIGIDANDDSGLWATDGTAAGTREIVPGVAPNGIDSSQFTAFNGKVLFNNGGLWATDGTAAGTYPVAPVAGGFGGDIRGLTVFNNEALFSQTGGLWVSDGTAEGTHELTDIAGASPDGIAPSGFTVFQGGVLFAGTDADQKTGLWITDGTEAGTHEITGITGAPPGGLSISNGVVFNDKVLFAGPDANNQDALWVTDGTAAGTHELTGIPGAWTSPLGPKPGYPGGLSPFHLIAFNDEVLFNGTDSNGNIGLWVTDGTAAGTHEISGDPIFPVNSQADPVAFSSEEPVTTPIVINSVSDFQAIRNDPAGHYVLGANIDASGFNFTSIADFSGVLDGAGYSISGLTTGLLVKIDASGIVENLHLDSVNISSAAKVGAIASENDGSIVGCSVSGSVTGGAMTGALVGENLGTITQSQSAGTITGTNYVGALVGFNNPSGSITQSFATGTANGQLDVGGLVGINQGTIAQSYATGTTNPLLNPGVAIGGLAGANSGSISQSYATGLVGAGGGFALGGLVGSGGDTVVTSYWDTDTTGRSASSGGTPLTTAQLESGILPAGFDPTVWFDTAGQFPELQWQAASTHPPTIVSIDSVFAGLLSELNNAIGSIALDYANNASATTPSGVIAFADPDSGDRPTSSVDTTHETVIYQNSNGQTVSLTTAQIATLEAGLSIAPGTGNANSGMIDWTYAITDETLDFLGAGETLTLTTPIVIDDGHGGTVTQDIVVTVNGENDAPTPVADVVPVQKGTTFTADKPHGVLANDTDPDITDISTLAVSAVNGSASLIGKPIKGTYGTLTLAADGSYAYVMKGTAPVGAQDVFQYTISDSHGGTATSTLTLQIPYPALTITSASLAGSVSEGSGANDTISPKVITYNVPDPSNRPTVSIDKAGQTVTWQDSTHDYSAELQEPQKAALLAALKNGFTINQTDTANAGKATWAYKIAESTLDFLTANETITVTTPILIGDHRGNVVTENVVVTLVGADDRPTLSGRIISAASEDDASYAINLLQLASDKDAHDALHVDNAGALPAGLSLVGDILYVDPSAYDYLSLGQHSTLNIKYDVVDSQGSASSTSATITIDGANDSPIADFDLALAEINTKIKGNILANDLDPDARDALHVTNVGFSGVSINVSSGQVTSIDGNFGTLKLSADGGYNYVETQNQVPSAGGNDTFTYVIADQNGATAMSTLTISIPSPINNEVNLVSNSPAVEMIKLALDAYPFGDTGYHQADTLGALLSATNPSAASDILTDNWHPMSSNELSLAPTVHSAVGISYSFKSGYYQAIAVGDALGHDSSEADALVLTGIVDGKRTLAISFAGTDQKSDWMNYANFADQYSKFAPLVSAIKQYIDSGAVDQVLVSGHSLGAAMAQDFIEDAVFQNDAHFNAHAWTIGSPGAETAAFDIPDSRVVNFYHQLDPVFQSTELSQALANPVSASQVAERAYILANMQSFLVDDFRFTPQEAQVVAADLAANTQTKVHAGTNVEIPFGEPVDPNHVISIPGLGINIDIDAHDQSGYLRDVTSYLLTHPGFDLH